MSEENVKIRDLIKSSSDLIKLLRDLIKLPTRFDEILNFIVSLHYTYIDILSYNKLTDTTIIFCIVFFFLIHINFLKVII